jgi:protein SCO1/2
LARWLYGVDVRGRDLRLAALEAGEGTVTPSLGDRLLMLCYRYDPVQGRYGDAVMGALRLGAAATVGLLGLGIGGAVLREARRRRKAGHA